MKYRRLITRDEIYAGIELWNRQYPDFQIVSRLVEQNIFAPFAGVHNIAWGGFQGERLVGFILVKYLSQGIPQSADPELGWVSLLVVDQQVMSPEVTGLSKESFQLFRLAEQDLYQRGVKRVRFGGDPQNFLPGLPEELISDYLPLLEKIGYEVKGNEYDLYGDLAFYNDLPKVAAVECELGDQLEAKPVTKDEEQDLLQFLQIHFPGRWYYEADQIRRIPGGVDDYWLLWYQGAPVGFVRTNTSHSVYMGPNVNWGNRYGDAYCGLGPIGMDREYRGKGFGLYLMEKVIHAFQQQGYRHMMIDWTQLIDYYQKIGFEPVVRYTTLMKELKGCDEEAC